MSDVARYFGGRPTKLTDALIVRASTLVAQGLPHKLVAQALDIDEGTFIDWMKRGKESDLEPYASFYQSIQRAHAQGAIALQEKILASANEDWKAAAWLLERRYPEHYAKVKPEPPPAQPQQHIHMHILSDLAQRGIISDTQLAQIDAEIIDSRSEPLPLDHEDQD